MWKLCGILVGRACALCLFAKNHLFYIDRNNIEIISVLTNVCSKCGDSIWTSESRSVSVDLDRTARSIHGVPNSAELKKQWLIKLHCILTLFLYCIAQCNEPIEIESMCSPVSSTWTVGKSILFSDYLYNRLHSLKVCDVIPRCGALVWIQYDLNIDIIEDIMSAPMSNHASKQGLGTIEWL